MRILHTSDWHIGKIFNDHSMIDDQQYIISKIKDIIVSHKVDAMIIAGDLYDRRIPSEQAVNMVDDFLCDLTLNYKLPVMCIAGNHDSGDRLNFASRLYEKSGLYICGSLSDIPKKISFKDAYGKINFYMLPYIEPIQIRKIYNNKQIKSYNDAYRYIVDNLIKPQMNTNERNIIIAHGFFSAVSHTSELLFSRSEVNIGGCDIVDSSIFNIFDYTALGHLHTPQKAGSEKIRYSGSILKYSVDETKTDKSVVLIDMKEKHDINVDLIKLKPKRDVRIIKGYFDDILKENQESDDYVYLELKDSHPIPDAALRLKNKYHNLLGIKYSNNIILNNSVVLSSEQIKHKSYLELFESFYKYADGGELNNEQSEQISAIFNEIGKTI